MLVDAYRLYLVYKSGFDTISIVDHILKQALIGLRLYSDARPLDDPAHARLAFRELGLSIGLHSVDFLRQKHNEEHYADYELDFKGPEQICTLFGNYRVLLATRTPSKGKIMATPFRY